MNKKQMLSFFMSADCYPKAYLRGKLHAYAAFGIKESYQSIPENLNENTFIFQARDFSEQKRTSDLWGGFSPLTIFTPKVGFIDGKCMAGDSTTLSHTEHSAQKNEVYDLCHHLNFSQWDQLLLQTKQAPLHKVVLARLSSMEAKNPLQTHYALEQLSQLPGYLFAFAPSKEQIFFGLSPEHLYIREGKTLKTEALAGTRARGNNPLDDKQLEQELLQSKKDHEEFGYVSEHILDKLHLLCNRIEKGNIQVKKTPNVQHLNQTFSGILKKAISDETIVNTLHPTPAMCGTPTEKALDWIKKQELFDRGYYAGPLGFITKNQAETILSIRSCLIQKKHAHLFAGLGVVKDSDSALEWKELDAKLSLMHRALICPESLI